MEVIQLFFLIQRRAHITHAGWEKWQTYDLWNSQSLRVRNIVNELKYPINICTSNIDDN